MPLYNPLYPQNNNPFQQALMQQYQQNMMNQTATTVFINVPSEDVARRWDIAPNTTGKFIDENKGYIYTKSVGASILEPPVFEKYRVVKETEESNESEPQNSQPEPDLSEYMTKSEFETYKAIIDEMQEVVKELKG